MIKVYIQINGQMIPENDFRSMCGCPQGSVVFLGTLVEEYNAKNSRDAEIVMFRGKKKLFA